MTVTISRLYDTYEEASQVVTSLEAAGLPHSEISIVASNADSWYAGKQEGKRPTIDRDHDGVDDRVEGAEAGAGIGAVLGGGAGLLAGVGLLSIPGIGPVVAAGWLFSAVTGAVAGGATGGLIGALTQTGAGEEDAEIYAEGLRRGAALVTARVPENDCVQYEAIMNRNAIHIKDRAAAYRRGGWSSFNNTGKPYTAEQVRKEREMYARTSRP